MPFPQNEVAIEAFGLPPRACGSFPLLFLLDPFHIQVLDVEFIPCEVLDFSSSIPCFLLATIARFSSSSPVLGHTQRGAEAEGHVRFIHNALMYCTYIWT